jgi:hypothetical protein
MKNYEKYLNEAFDKTLNEDVSMTANELAEKIKLAIKEVFPNSYVVSKFSTSFYPSIHVKFTLGKDQTEWSNGIIDNDPMIHDFTIDAEGRELNSDGTLPEKVTIDTHRGGSISTAPTEKYMAYGRLKLGFRKKTDSPEKIVDYIKKYFSRAKEIIKQNIEKMHPREIDFIKSKVNN